MAIFNTDALVLKQFDLGEADKIITFYSKERGKIRAVAKNASKGKSTRSGRVLPFTYNNITVYRGSSIDKLNQVSNKFSFTALRENLNKMAYASYMAEIIEKVGMEDDPNPPLFSLLLATFHKMLDAAENELDNINLAFKLRTLTILGFKPELEKCLFCEKSLKISSKNIFDIASGGLVCSDCFQQSMEDEVISYLSGESLQVIKKILNSGLKIPQNLKVSPNGFKELDQLIDKFIKYHLDLKLKSQKFLHMIRDLG